MRFQRAESPALLNGQDAARSFFAGCFATQGSHRERLWVAHVDEQARCLHVEQYEGEPDSVALPVRDIMADAAQYGSAGIILAHNHPGGDPRPSREDCVATKRLARAGEMLDVAILDHLIFAGDRCSSMRKLGLL